MLVHWHVANGWQASSYGPPYGRRPPTVPTVNPTATLKTVGATTAGDEEKLARLLDGRRSHTVEGTIASYAFSDGRAP